MSSYLIGAQGGRTLHHASSSCFGRRLSSVSCQPYRWTKRLACRHSGASQSERSRSEKQKNASLLQHSQSTRRHAFSSTPFASDASPSSSSVSASEVAHFSLLASSWWDPHGPSRLLHLMNPLRHDFIRSCLSSSNAEPRKYSYLDVGCGGGIFATSAARLPSTTSVTGIDPTQECIAVAENKQRSDPALQPPKLKYLNCSIESLPQEVSKVDIVTLFEVIEHIDHPSTFLAECAKHLKQGGWIIGSTIARSPMSFLTTKVIAEAPMIGVVPRGTHDWNKYINPHELQGWFEGKAEGKWGVFQTQGVIYIPALGWKVVQGSEGWGNYFFGIQKLE